MKRLDSDTITIGGMTELVSVDTANDFVPVWDASAGQTRKVKPVNLGFSAGNAYGFITATPTGALNDYNPAGWSTATNQHRVLRLTPTDNVVLTGLADGADGDFATLINESADYLIIVAARSTASVAANRIAGRQPIFLLGGSSVTMFYFGGQWNIVDSSDGDGFYSLFDAFEDFTGTAGPFGNAVSGTGASAQAGTYLQNTTEKPIGVWQIDTGTTATGRAHLGAVSNSAIAPAWGRALYLTRLAVEALSSGTERFQVFAGFHDAVGGTNVTDGVYWNYRDDVSAAWQAGVATGGTRVENFAAGPTVDTNYIWLGIYMNAAWTRASFFHSQNSIDWTFAGSRTTGLPTTAQFFGYGNTINKTIGTTQRNLSTDLMGFLYEATRG